MRRILHGKPVMDPTSFIPSAELATTLCLGLVLLVPLVSLISLFHPIDGWIHLGLVCFVIAFSRPYRLWGDFYDSLRRDGWLKSKTAVTIGAVGFLWVAFISAGGSREMVDTPGYHMSTVQWIREYGVVPGLANLSERLGTNSSWHVFCAFIEQGPFRGGSSHLAGLLVFTIFSLGCLPGIVSLSSGKLTVTGIFQSISFVIILWGSEWLLTSLSTDWPMVVLIFFAILTLINCIESMGSSRPSDNSPFPVFLVVVLTSLAVTIKLTAVPYLLILSLSIIFVIRDFSIKTILLTVILSSCVIMPYLARNVIVSGHLIYPSTAFDWFDVDWKVPQKDVIGQSNFLKEWGYYSSDWDLHASEEISSKNWILKAHIWFRTWVLENKSGDHCFSLFFLSFLGIALWPLIILLKDRSVRPALLIYLWVQLGIFFCLLFGVMSSPTPRFLWVYVVFLGLVPLSIFFKQCGERYIMGPFVIRLGVFAALISLLVISGENYGMHGMLTTGHNGYGTGWVSILFPQKPIQPVVKMIKSLNGVVCGVTDSNALLVPHDILDASALSRQLVSGQNDVSKYLWGKFSPSSKEKLQAASYSSELLAQTLTDELDHIIIGESIYGLDRFKGVVLSANTRNMIEYQIRKKCTSVLLNRWLLEDAYPSLLAISNKTPEECILWNTPLPCSDHPHPYLAMRGENVRDGYRVTSPRTQWQGWSRSEVNEAISKWGLAFTYIK